MDITGIIVVLIAITGVAILASRLRGKKPKQSTGVGGGQSKDPVIKSKD